jgi:hypothetical protein
MNPPCLKLPLLVIALLLCTLAGPHLLCAQENAQPVTIESVELGFGGTYKVGHWSPVKVIVSAGDRTVQVRPELSVPDGDGVQTFFVTPDRSTLQIPAGSRATIRAHVKPGRSDGELTVRLMDGDAEVASRVFPAGSFEKSLRSTDELIVAFGSPVGLADAVRKARRHRSREAAIQTVQSAEDAPIRWYGYDAVDWVVVTTSEVGAFERLTEEQFAAVDRWLQLGGRLVLCVGRRGGEIFAPGSRLARFAPGDSPEVISQRITSGLENYAGADDRLDSVGGQRARRFSVPMTAFRNVRGLVESEELGAAAGRLPTIIRSPYGLGQVVLVAFDPDLAPFDRWQGRPVMMARILQMAALDRRAEPDVEARIGRVAHLGYDDMAGQLRSALDQFQGVTRVRFSWVAGLIAAYILLIGPGDYLLLKKFRRMHWTWITFPVVTLAFCLIAYGLVGRLAGRQLHITQVDLVDVDVERSVLRGSSWTHVYSPVAQTFDFSLATSDVWSGSGGDSKGELLAWQGLPGEGLGGLDTTSASALFAESYRIRLPDAGQSAAAITDMPFEVSGSKSLSGTWWDQGHLSVDRELAVDGNGLLSGRLRNPLSIELSDCRVMYQNWIYPLAGVLVPGETVSFDGVSPRNLQWHLTRRRVIDTKDIGTPWDRSSLDIPRMMEVMMFYRAAGGETYTGLTHRYQGRIDLSDHLRGGRAILVGRGKAAASQLHRDGRPLRENYDRHWTIYRLIFPVDEPDGG